MIQIPRMSIFAAGTLLLLACSREAQAPENNVMDASAGDAEDGSRRTFSLARGDGAELGSVTVQEDVRGLSMTVAARAMAVGAHGLHLHQKGLCDGPKFESAGPHWNPAAKKHGRDNPQGAHLGDLANLTIGSAGTSTTSVRLDGVMMTSGSMPLADADGTSLVVHAKPDDYKTDPSGASGDRIACAVLAAPR